MEYSIIVNPLAGSGRAKKIWQQLQSRLNELNIVYQVVETRYHGHAVANCSSFCFCCGYACRNGGWRRWNLARNTQWAD